MGESEPVSLLPKLVNVFPYHLCLVCRTFWLPLKFCGPHKRSLCFDKNRTINYRVGIRVDTLDHDVYPLLRIRIRVLPSQAVVAAVRLQPPIGILVEHGP